jgi:hypothetical protein
MKVGGVTTLLEECEAQCVSRSPLQCSGSASRLVGLLRYWGWLDSKTAVAGLPSSMRHLVSNNGKHSKHNYSFGTPNK